MDNNSYNKYPTSYFRLLKFLKPQNLREMIVLAMVGGYGRCCLAMKMKVHGLLFVVSTIKLQPSLLILHFLEP